MTWKNEVRAVMDRALEVYITKDEAKNAQRARRKEEVIDWTVEQLERGWQPAGTARDLPCPGQPTIGKVCARPC